MESAITLNNIWKKYNIGQPKKLGDALPMFLSGQKLKEFWALKNISLVLNKGDRLGIIGPNGSGKSTLLKILAGVTTPSRGKINVSGKIASLLEVGTGFHPDFTGRENVYLYGTILGMGLPEIKYKFDEIVTFSGIKKFLDTPVKYYSSGMYVRLAFAVAVHLQWDILLLDEVLSVGDLEFQKKSFNKIKQLISGNKTLILVSHNLDMIKKLCDKALLLENGKIKKIGTVDAIVNYYLSYEK